LDGPRGEESITLGSVPDCGVAFRVPVPASTDSPRRPRTRFSYRRGIRARRGNVGIATGIAVEPPPIPLRGSRWRWRIGNVFVVADSVAAVAGVLLIPMRHDAAVLWAPVAATLLAANRADLHRSRLELSVLEDLPSYLFMTLIGSATLLVATAPRTGATPLAHIYLFGLIYLVLLAALRFGAYTVVRALRRSRYVSHPVVIVGSGYVGQRLAKALLAHPEYGVRPVGFVDSDPQEPAGQLPLPLLGGLDRLVSVLTSRAINDVVFAFNRIPDAQVVHIVRACVQLDRQVFVVPRFFELSGAERRGRVEVVWGIPLLRLRRWPQRPGHSWIKRSTDVALAGTALALLSPVFAACAIAVRVVVGPRVIYQQVRVGRDGRTFTLLKFRSMPCVDGVDPDTRWSIDGDPRIGKVGRFLRRTGLDELPQLINVVRGDMSLVGPRPERPAFAKAFGQGLDGYGDRHRMATGLTGWAQVNGLRGDTSIEDRVVFDNYYIENWSFWTDIKIMLRTLRTPFRRDRV
jgi:exopolysaccharide biosynthesis polyprenyl glycosylphosphotransferase